MTVHLDAEDVRLLATPEVAFRAARAVLEAQRRGTATLPARQDVDLSGGYLRCKPAALEPLMGLKVMTLVRGVGTRYVILLFSQPTGELLATIDAAEVTRIRTAATTAIAGELLAPAGTPVLALVGSGWEAEGHLRAFAHLWSLDRVMVHSPSAERRQRFASRMSDELGLDVVPVATVREAIGGAPVSVLCTKASEPVVDGEAFPPDAVVLSIGSTRLDLRELDDVTMRRSSVVLVDDPGQVASESGDVAAGLVDGQLATSHLVAMQEWHGVAPHPGDLLTFKSVGTALQDLALAAELLVAAEAAGRGRDLGQLAALKAFANSPTASTLGTS